MIELLNKNNQADIQKVSVKSSTKEDLSDKKIFKEQFDKSISQQKSLKEEINSQKTEDTKKALKELNKKIQQLEETLSEEVVEGVGLPENLNMASLISLEEIVSFLEQSLEVSIDSGDIQEVSFLDEWVSDMVEVIDQNLEHPENGFVFQKVAFILENVDTTNIDTKVEQTLTNALTSLQQEISQEVSQEVSHTQRGKIVLDSSFDSVTNVEIESLENIVENTDIEVSDDNVIAKESSSSDFQSDNKEQKNQKEQKFEVSDLRTKNIATNIPSDEPAFTLENMDNESSDNFISDIAKVQKSDTIAERSYASLSSAVSRVQVEALMQNVSGKISVILQDGGNELRMKLTPPELGQMKLSFLTEDGMMRGKVIVETPEAKLLFEQNINNLRESLASVGVDLGSVDVELGNQNDFSEQLEKQNNLKAVRGNDSSEIVEEITTRRQLMDVLVDFIA